MTKYYSHYPKESNFGFKIKTCIRPVQSLNQEPIPCRLHNLDIPGLIRFSDLFQLLPRILHHPLVPLPHTYKLHHPSFLPIKLVTTPTSSFIRFPHHEDHLFQILELPTSAWLLMELIWTGILKGFDMVLKAPRWEEERIQGRIEVDLWGTGIVGE